MIISQYLRHLFLKSLFIFIGLLIFESSFADDFAVIATPPRFEINGKSGAVIRQVIEITNASSAPAKYNIKTTDWTLDANGGVEFTDTLQPNSCRSWVSLERLQLSVPSGAKYRFRFEVNPPTDAIPGECRFAIMIEGDEQAAKTANGLTIPYSGRLGVIVYVGIGEIKSQLTVISSEVKKVNEVPKPFIHVRNSGNAHGRLTGFLSGTDAVGKKFEYAPSGLPILAGEVREISLDMQQQTDIPLPIIKYPITIRGNLEWDDKSIPFEQEFGF